MEGSMSTEMCSICHLSVEDKDTSGDEHQ